MRLKSGFVMMVCSCCLSYVVMSVVSSMVMIVIVFIEVIFWCMSFGFEYSMSVLSFLLLMSIGYL